MRKLLILACTGLILVVSCKKDEDPPAGSNNNQANINNLSSLKAKLLEKDQDDVLINSISTNSSQKTVIEYEDAFKINAASGLVDSAMINGGTWVANFTFSDNTTMAYQALGDSLGIPDSALVLNPTGVSPLTARASFSSPVNGMIEVTVKSKATGLEDYINQIDQYGTQHEVPVFGLYEDFLNEVVFTLKSKTGVVRRSQSFMAQTINRADSSFSANVKINNLPNTGGEFLFFSTHKLAIDLSGNIRWFITDPTIGQIIRKLPNGNILAFSNPPVYRPYHVEKVLEINPFGEKLAEIDIPELLHHEAREMPNGNFLVATNSVYPVDGDGLPEEEVVIEITPSGAIVDSWDFNVILDSARPALPTTAVLPDDWIHINAVIYDEVDDAIIISGRGQNAVAKVDRVTKEVIWIIAPHNDWKPELQSKLLTPTNFEDDRDWCYGQHAPMILENGNIFIFDNGDQRKELTPATEDYSRGVEYSINEQTMEITKVAEYGNDRLDLYSQFQGDVDVSLIGDSEYRTVNFSMVNDVLVWNNMGSVVFEVDATSLPVFNYRTEFMKLY